MSWGLSGGELAQIEWRAPAAWLILLLPLLPRLLARWRTPAWEHYAEPHLQAWALRRSGIAPHCVWCTLYDAAIFALLACALAGPRLPIETQGGGRAQHDIDIMVVLDVSPSMAATDIAPYRLLRAKLKLQDLQTRLHGERLGLIAYSGEAGLLLPLNHDLRAFQSNLDLASDALFDAPGSNLAAALELAQKTLQASKRPRAILLLSDAEASSLSGVAGDAALSAARSLNTAHIPLYILALGSEAGATIPLKEGGSIFVDGAAVISRADIPGYRALAQMSGGTLALVRDDEGDWRTLYDNGLLKLRAPADTNDVSRAWRELFAYPLALAFILLLLRGLRLKPSALLLAASLGSSQAQADDATLRAAYDAYTQGAYLNAQQGYAQLPGYAARMGEGAAAYKRRDYSYAQQQFSLALIRATSATQTADALFNLGDSYISSGNLVAAADAFAGVLRLRPNDVRAQKNLSYTQAQLARRAANAPQTAGIPGRRGAGVVDAPAGAETPLSMAQEKDETRPLLELETSDARNARRTGRALNAAKGSTEADRRAALKQLDLLKDDKLAVSKQLLKQDAQRKPSADMPPW